MGTQTYGRETPYEEILAFTGYDQPKFDPQDKKKYDGQAFFETQGRVLAMRRDGFEVREIAEQLGYAPERIEMLLSENVTTGSPEEVLQESRSIIDKLHGMKDNEEMFRNVVRKILHPFCRDLVKDMMEQVKVLNETDLKPEAKEARGVFGRRILR